MAYKLVCTLAFHKFNPGDTVLDPDEVAKHLAKRDQHFVKVAMTVAEQQLASQIVAAREAAKAAPAAE
jgi:hypothetical protein